MFSPIPVLLHCPSSRPLLHPARYILADYCSQMEVIHTHLHAHARVRKRIILRLWPVCLIWGYNFPNTPPVHIFSDNCIIQSVDQISHAPFNYTQTPITHKQAHRYTPLPYLDYHAWCFSDWMAGLTPTGCWSLSRSASEERRRRTPSRTCAQISFLYCAYVNVCFSASLKGRRGRKWVLLM